MPAPHRSVARRLISERTRRTLGAASCVRERLRFVSSELRSVHGSAKYHLRRSGLLAEVRHPLLDMWVLEEVFRLNAYAPPPAAASALSALGRPPKVLDLGGHVGYFALRVLELYPEASIESFEPDPRNADVLERTIAANGAGERWRLVRACAAASDRSVEFDSSFHLSNIAQRSALDSKQKQVVDALPFLAGGELLRPARIEVEAKDALPSLLEADLVKMDIEGGEWELLADPRFAEVRASAVVLEYHPEYGKGDDADATVRRRLRAAGLTPGPTSYGDSTATLWAWRTS